MTAVTGVLDHGAQPAQVDDAVARHAAIEDEVAGGHEPVADVVSQDAPAATHDLPRQIGVPPQMIDVNCDADAVAQLVAEVVGVGQRIHAGAIGRGHGVKRLDRKRHAGGTRIRQHRCDPVPHLRMCAGEILRARRQTAGHQHQAFRSDRRGFIDGAAVIVERGPAPRFVGGGKHSAAAQASHAQTAGADEACRARKPALLDDVSPRRDSFDARACAAFDRLLERPRFHRRGVDGQRPVILGEVAHQASTPRIAMTARMRRAARSASARSPAASASRNSSARWRVERALSWPPTIVKWSWSPLR